MKSGYDSSAVKAGITMHRRMDILRDVYIVNFNTHVGINGLHINANPNATLKVSFAASTLEEPCWEGR